MKICILCVHKRSFEPFCVWILKRVGKDEFINGRKNECEQYLKVDSLLGFNTRSMGYITLGQVSNWVVYAKSTTTVISKRVV